MSKKYIEVYDMLRVNELDELGYKLHSVTPRTYADDATGRIKTDHAYMMSLSSEKAYDNITHLIDIPPHEVDNWLKAGFIVADSWSKVVRMVKKVVE